MTAKIILKMNKTPSLFIFITNGQRGSFFMKERLWYSTVFGALAVYFLSLLWDKLYFLSENIILSIFSPVNKSLFEQSKAIIFPFLIYSIIEYFLVKPNVKIFVSSKAFACLSIAFVQFVLYYSYLFFTDRNLNQAIVIVNALALFSGFIVFFKLYFSEYDMSRLFIPAIIVIVLMFALNITFTIISPKIDYFKDPFLHEYGAIEYYTQDRVDIDKLN